MTLLLVTRLRLVISWHIVAITPHTLKTCHVIVIAAGDIATLNTILLMLFKAIADTPHTSLLADT